VLLHAVLSFVYNTAILAFVLNLVFGLPASSSPTVWRWAIPHLFELLGRNDRRRLTTRLVRRGRLQTGQLATSLQREEHLSRQRELSVRVRREHPAQEKQIARPAPLPHTRRTAQAAPELDAKFVQPLFGAAGENLCGLHLPTCAPHPTCSTSRHLTGFRQIDDRVHDVLSHRKSVPSVAAS